MTPEQAAKAAQLQTKRMSYPQSSRSLLAYAEKFKALGAFGLYNSAMYDARNARQAETWGAETIEFVPLEE